MYTFKIVRNLWFYGGEFGLETKYKQINGYFVVCYRVFRISSISYIGPAYDSR